MLISLELKVNIKENYMRVYKTLYEAVNESLRDLYVRGISVECESYQDKKLTGEDRIVKELIGVDFKVDKPLYQRDEIIKYVFKDEASKILKYCKQEIKDRTSGKPLNPGNSYKIRSDMWNKFLENDNKFSYQYAERIWTNNQFENVINILRKDKGTRQAVLSIWNSSLDINMEKLGGGNRVPCSLNYQFLIRNDRLHCIYSMRSNDALAHHVIDLYCATGLMEYVVNRLKDIYPSLKVGSLTYLCGSFHVFNWELKNWVLF